MSEFLWGIDLGGTKIECIVLDTDLNIVHRERIATKGEEGYQVVLTQIQKLISNVSSQVGAKPKRIGIGTPGFINSHTQKLRNCNSVYLNGHTFKIDIEEKLEIPVKVTNDANCFAVSEYKLGIVREEFPDARVVLGIIMGTGVGLGIVVNGKIIEGKNGIGGEWGHNFLDDSGGKCYCGKEGCVEKVISGPALEKFYTDITESTLQLKEIVELYRGGDQKAGEVMQRLFRFFAKAVANVINIIDPDVIVIGGGVGNIDELYTEGLRELDHHVFGDYISTSFVKPKYGDSSGVLGAALLWT